MLAKDGRAVWNTLSCAPPIGGRFPEEFYRRSGGIIYRYESAGGAFTRDLRVNDDGFIIDYPDFWQIEGVSEAKQHRS